MIASISAKRRDLLRETAMFSGLPDDDTDAILAYARVARYAAGAAIFAKGAPGDSLMAILKGRVRISALTIDGKEVVYNIMGPGEVFGEIALLDGNERTADAAALTGCELLVVDRRSFLPLLERRPDLCIRLLVVLCERLRRKDEQVEDAFYRHIEARLAKALLRLAREHGTGEPGALRIDIGLSQSELAGIVGGSRETINKYLKVWQRAGIIGLSRSKIVIRDIEALRSLG